MKNIGTKKSKLILIEITSPVDKILNDLLFIRQTKIYKEIEGDIDRKIVKIKKKQANPHMRSNREYYLK